VAHAFRFFIFFVASIGAVGYLHVGWCGLYVPPLRGMGAAALCVVYL
jgi:hypothetical protein